MQKKIAGLGWLFYVTVAIPTVLSAIYFGLIASDVYISQSEFVVRAPDKGTTTGLGFLLKSAGFSNSGEEVHAAQNYIESRDALRAINKGGAFQSAYQADHVSILDRFDPTGWYGSFEYLYKYFNSRVKADFDSSSSITTLTVRAYDPKSAFEFNEKLLEMAEQTVNTLNARGRSDLISFAEQEVVKAKREALNTAQALSDYRNRVGVLDPEKQAVVQIQMISKLQDELIATNAQLAELRRSAPANPQVETLQARAASIQKQMDQEEGKVTGSQSSLAGRAANYQRLALENEVASKQLASAMASLQEAQNEARRKQAYVERIVQPNLPDTALEPRRLRGIIVTFAMGLVAWGVFSMLLAGVAEHRN